MAAIEVITSQERELTIRKPDGETTIVLVRIWNETVSNLTLMALGAIVLDRAFSTSENSICDFLAAQSSLDPYSCLCM